MDFVINQGCKNSSNKKIDLSCTYSPEKVVDYTVKLVHP